MNNININDKISTRTARKINYALTHTRSLSNALDRLRFELTTLNSFVKHISDAILSLTSEMNSDLQKSADSLGEGFQSTIEGLDTALQISISGLSAELQGMLNNLSSELKLTNNELNLDLEEAVGGLSTNLQTTVDDLRTRLQEAFEAVSGLKFDEIVDPGSQKEAVEYTERLTLEFTKLQVELSGLTMYIKHVSVGIQDIVDGIGEGIIDSTDVLDTELQTLINEMTSTLEGSVTRLGTSLQGIISSFSTELQTSNSELSEGLQDTVSELSNELQTTINGLGVNLQTAIGDLNTAIQNAFENIIAGGGDVRTDLDKILDVAGSVADSITTLGINVLDILSVAEGEHLLANIRSADTAGLMSSRD